MTKTESALRSNSSSSSSSSSVVREEKTRMEKDFENQFIFKLTSIVFDVGSTAELLRFQIQVGSPYCDCMWKEDPL